MNFKVNDYLVYGGFGIGKIQKIQEMEIFGIKDTFYTIKFKTMSVNLPTSKINELTRPLSDSSKINQAKEIMASKESVISLKNWNQKFNEYKNTINSGDILEMAKIIATLRNKQEPSFGEKKLLASCEEFVNDEIRIASALNAQKEF